MTRRDRILDDIHGLLESVAELDRLRAILDPHRRTDPPDPGPGPCRPETDAELIRRLVDTAAQQASALHAIETVLNLHPGSAPDAIARGVAEQVEIAVFCARRAKDAEARLVAIEDPRRGYLHVGIDSAAPGTDHTVTTYWRRVDDSTLTAALDALGDPLFPSERSPSAPSATPAKRLVFSGRTISGDRIFRCEPPAPRRHTAGTADYVVFDGRAYIEIRVGWGLLEEVDVTGYDVSCVSKG